jgi:hypothetical protein
MIWSERIGVKSLYTVRGGSHMPSQPIEGPGMKIRFLVEGNETNDAVSIFRCDFEAGRPQPDAAQP